MPYQLALKESFPQLRLLPLDDSNCVKLTHRTTQYPGYLKMEEVITRRISEATSQSHSGLQGLALSVTFAARRWAIVIAPVG